MCSSLAPRVDSAIRRKRSEGSGSWVARWANMADTRLLALPFSSSVRTETGMHATRESSGRSPRSSRYLRNVPDMIASTTSLTLTPNASLISLTPAKGTRAKATSR